MYVDQVSNQGPDRQQAGILFRLLAEMAMPAEDSTPVPSTSLDEVLGIRVLGGEARWTTPDFFASAVCPKSSRL